MIRSVLVALTAMAATVVAGGPAMAANYRTVPAADVASKLSLDASQSTERQASKTYIVRMAAKPAASYQGDVAGFAKSAPEKGQRYNAQSSQAQQYTKRLVAQHDFALASVGAANKKLYSYTNVLNGFAARLTPIQAAKLRKNKAVLNVWEDERLQLDTNNTPKFLGLMNPENGLRSAQGLTGEGVIIGIVDGGIVPNHPSFSGDRFDAPPAHWAGICQSGEGWSRNDCNNKLIGARWFAAGFTAQDDAADGDFFSPRDSDGHGTHTASTAGGNRVRASLNGHEDLAAISGMAPRARIAAYKVCYNPVNDQNGSCYSSDSVAAIDTAVADGVDVINFSIGGPNPTFGGAVGISFLGALDAGVFVSQSGGNDGPAPGTIGNAAPWATSVGGTTHRGTNFVLATTIISPIAVSGDYPSLEGAITQPLSESGVITDVVVAADPLDACAEIDPIDGIALIVRGTCTFDDKITNAVNAGATAVIVYTDDRPKAIMAGDTTQPIPGVMIDNDIGVELVERFTSGLTVTARLDGNAITTEGTIGNVMGAFSSRSPFLVEPSFIKPDVTAPGVMVLAGSSPDQFDGSEGGLFAYETGTSMAAPHVAGIAALLREAHPDWSPAVIKSALMTTARQKPIKKEDGVTKADPFDMGAGHIVPNLAVDPGLAYDFGFLEALGGTCGTSTPLVTEEDCDFLADELGVPIGAPNFNLASIGYDGLIGRQTVVRTVTNVGDAEATYTVSVIEPPGIRVDVEPTTLTLAPGESATYEITLRNRSAPAGVWRFGSLTWTDGVHVVRSPMAVSAEALIAPAEVTGAGSDGSTSFDVGFGYNGEYTAAPHGLVDAFLSMFEVTDDPANSFDFNFEPDEPIVYLLDLPEGTAYAQWNLYNAYNNSEDHDLDLYLLYCPGFSCTLIDASLGLTSDERVSVQFPATNGAPADPADADDPYVLIVHGYQTDGGAPAQGILFDWTVIDDEGNLTVTAPPAAVRGQTLPVELEWTGLTTGAGAKQAGAVSHSDASGIIGLTIVNIANDPGAGFCDLAGC